MRERIEITVEKRPITPWQGFPKEWFDEGFRQGRRQGKREPLLHQLAFKFGELPQTLVERIEHIEDEALLNRLGEQVITASTLAEIQLEDDSSANGEAV